MELLPDERATNLVVWALLWSALLGWQVACARSRRLPTIAGVVQALRRWWPTRWLLVAWWCWLGWHAFVRTNF